MELGTQYNTYCYTLPFLNINGIGTRLMLIKSKPSYLYPKLLCINTIISFSFVLCNDIGYYLQKFKTISEQYIADSQIINWLVGAFVVSSHKRRNSVDQNTHSSLKKTTYEKIAKCKHHIEFLLYFTHRFIYLNGRSTKHHLFARN